MSENAETKRKKLARKNVYLSEKLSLRQRQLVLSLLNWRYGISSRVNSPDEASIIVMADDSDASYDQPTEKLLLPGYSLQLLRKIGDSYLQIQREMPKLIVPFGDDWIINQLKARGYEVLSCEEIAMLTDRFMRANDEQRLQISSQMFAKLLNYIREADYAVVMPERFPLHLVVAVYSKAMHKITVAEAAMPIIAAIVDFPVSRREDLIGMVDAITGAR